MVAQEPVEPHLLAQLLEVAPAVVDALCAELAGAYEADQRGFELVRVAGGYRLQSHADLAPYVERFALEGQTARLSAAALETLAIVAYKQPLSRAQVAAIRGVNVDGVMRTLQQRGYVAEVGRDGGPGLRRTEVGRPSRARQHDCYRGGSGCIPCAHVLSRSLFSRRAQHRRSPQCRQKVEHRQCSHVR